MKAMKMSVSPRTLALYEKSGREFSEFRFDRGLSAVWPIPIDHIMEYCVSLHRRGLATGTIRGKLAGLSFAAKVNGWPDSTSDVRIRRMLEGWARSTQVKGDDRKPITPDLLVGLNQQWMALCFSEFEQLLFHATALVTFFGAFRISEVLAQSKNDKSHAALLFSDVHLHEEQVNFYLRRSKTDQKGRGAQIALAKAPIAEICPVLAMANFLAARGGRPGYLFSHSDGLPLTKYQFWAVAKKALSALGFVGCKFGTHSFRIGAATCLLYTSDAADD